jgi:hypothetical protein
MRMLHVFALVVSFNLFACVTDGADDAELDDSQLVEDVTDLPELEADQAALDQAQRALSADVALDRDMRPLEISAP